MERTTRHSKARADSSSTGAPGSAAGALAGLGGVPVVAVGSHDTASAVAAVPARDERFAYLSSGTWSLFGIERGEPGFRAFILQPEPDPTGVMTSAEGHYDSMYGRIRSAWRVESHSLTYRATVPGNTTATLFLPASPDAAVTEGGREARTAEGVTFLRYEHGKAVYSLRAGTYEFSVDRWRATPTSS